MADPEIIDFILNPRKENSQKILERLGLDRLPTTAEIDAEIEEELLKPRFPATDFQFQV